MAEPPKLLERIRMAVRARHYSIRRGRDVAMGAEEVNALSALLFLYRDVTCESLE